MANKLDSIGKSSTGMDENVAAALGTFFWVVGIVFIFIEKESKFVKYSCMQAAIFGVAGFVLGVVVAFIPVLNMLGSIISLAVFIVAVIMTVKAYQGEWFELPVVGNIAKEQVDKVGNKID